MSRWPEVQVSESVHESVGSPVAEQFVPAADGARLFVRAYGEPTERTAVVCIPGLTRTGRDFTEIATVLADERQVLAVDLRGRGRSDRDPTRRSYRLETYAD